MAKDQKTELLNKAIAASPKPENSKPDTYGGVADRERGGAKQSAPAHVRQVPITSDNIMAIDDGSMAVDAKSAPICAKNALASSWTSIMDRLDRTQPPRGTPPHRWRGFVGDCYAFLRSGWAAPSRAPMRFKPPLPPGAAHTPSALPASRPPCKGAATCGIA